MVTHTLLENLGKQVKSSQRLILKKMKKEYIVGLALLGVVALWLYNNKPNNSYSGIT
jgi:putative copper export protein